MRTREDIKSELFETYDKVNVAENKINELEGERIYLKERIDTLIDELAAWDVGEGGDE
ncbi:hypothetical protein ACQRCG_05035 [Bacillus altitudinis]|uniref:hypothetical protein n=1 Tax=Bacillus altitudinis TaxID=293387 RepID=UPI003D079C78